ncbi:MFS general substrate transporter [Daedaleopsis nitida]|nr:MFS general substrate transporter [Daedaleopsis nitida]
MTKSEVEFRASSTKAQSVSPPVRKDNAVDNDFPEGGLAAWSTLVGAFLVQICAFGYTTSFGVYEDYYKRVYLSHESSSAISWIGSINSFLVVSSGIVVGRLYDRGYFYHILYGGSLLQAFSLFMHSLAKPDAYYQILLSQGLGAGIGAGMLYIPCVAILSQYFHKRRALAMTVAASGSSLGAVIHPLMLNNTLNKPSVGFAIAARANAGLVAALLLLACLLMRTRTDPPKSEINLRDAAGRFVRDTPYLFTAFGMATFILAFYFPVFYLQLDAVTHGLDKTFSFYALVIMNASGFLGRVSPGFFVQVLGVGNMVIGSTFVCAIMILAMIGLGSVASVVIIAVIYGFFSGVYVSLLAPFIASMTEDMSELGARLGIAFFCCGIGSLIGTPIEGALLTGDYVWWRPALFSGVMGFVGVGCFVMSVILLRRRRHKPATDILSGTDSEKA